MKIYIVLCCCFILLGGCSGWRPMHPEGDREVPGADRLLTGRNLLACLDDTRSLAAEEFDAQIEMAEENLQYGREGDTLRFICLSLNTRADYEQLKHGSMILEQYLEDHPEAEPDLQGFRLLVDRLDYEIRNKWSSWKTLLNEKKALKAEIVSLQARIEELQNQIDQLKNIEEIIKSREMDHQ